jgi:hypothetical protein
MPPDWPEKAMVLPSGDQAMFMMAPTPGTRSRCSISVVATSRIAISWLPSTCAMKANLSLDGDHDPDDEMKVMASKCELLVGPASFFMTRPVTASATNSSISNRPRRAKKATSLPSGLTVGARFMSPDWRVACTTRSPAALGRVRPSSAGRNVRLLAAIQSLDSESVETPRTRRMPSSKPIRSDMR